MELKITEILDATQGILIAGGCYDTISDVSIDSRKTAAGNLFIPLKGTQCDGHKFIKSAFKHGANVSLVQRQNPAAKNIVKTLHNKILIEVEDPLKALGDIAGCWRRKLNTKIAAITGSNGKTTTKEMVWNIIAEKMPSAKNPGNWNNLIGLPLSLFQLDKTHKAAILEMGMSERGEICRLSEICRPQIGLITNIGPSHLEQTGSLDNIEAAKAELFEYLSPNDTAIINNDDARSDSLVKKTRAGSIISFGISKGDIHTSNMRCSNCSSSAFDLHVKAEKTTVHLKFPWPHFISNSLAAAAVAHALGAGIKDIKKGLETFTPVPGRMELIDLNGINIINDSYNANPASMNASLRALSSISSGSRKIAVLGDMLELGEQSGKFHKETGKTVADLNIDQLLAIGDFSSLVREGALSGGMDSSNIVLCSSINELALELKRKTVKGDSVLLKGSRKMGIEKVIGLLQINNDDSAKNH